MSEFVGTNNVTVLVPYFEFLLTGNYFLTVIHFHFKKWIPFNIVKCEFRTTIVNISILTCFFFKITD